MVAAHRESAKLVAMADDEFSPSADRLVEHNAIFADGFDPGSLAPEPTRRLAVVACMDSRLALPSILGLADDEAHVIRNAGGVLTDDVIRSLCLSQRYLGTREIVLVHHTDCGLQKVNEAEFRTEIEAEVGAVPTWALAAFDDPYDDVRESIRRLRSSPFLAHTDHIRGFVYDVDTGRLHEVDPDR